MTEKIEVLEPDVVAAKLNEVTRSAGLAEDSALALRGQFADYYGTIVEWRVKASLVTKPEDPTHQKIAREVRLGLRKVRCEVENTRKALKADSLARGKAIDGFANVLKYLCEPVEAALLDVEQYAERQEAARVAAIVADRQNALVSLGADPTPYNLAAMDDQTFELVLVGEKKKRDERIESERKAEQERIEREQADRIAREKAEKEAAEARAAAAKAEAQVRKEREAREKAELEAAAARKSEQDRIAKEKAEAAAKAKGEREAAEKAARAPDKEKVMSIAESVRQLKCSIPMKGSTIAGDETIKLIGAKFDQFVQWIEKQAASL